MAGYRGGIGGGGATLDQTLAQLDATSPALNALAIPKDAPHWEYRCLVAGTWSRYWKGDLSELTVAADWPIAADAAIAATGFAIADDKGTVLITATGLGFTSGRFRTLPAAPYDITIDIEAQLAVSGFNAVCLMFRQSSDNQATQLRALEFDPAGGATIRTTDVDTDWVFVGPTITDIADGYLMGRRVRIRVVDADAGTRTISLIGDGGEETIFETRDDDEHNSGVTTYNEIGVAIIAPGVADSMVTARITGVTGF